MRKAVVDIVMVAAALLVIFLIVMLVIFGRQAGVFQQSLSADKIIKANEQCKAFTATALRKNDQLIDTDFDDMADVCDVCPNNYLSSKGDQLDTDTDKDGLSEEQDRPGKKSPYNRGEYIVNDCDRSPPQPAKAPQCANDWDDVRGKCRCTQSGGFYQDRCATGPEWAVLKNQAFQPAIRTVLQQIHELFKQLKFREAKQVWDAKMAEWQAQGVAPNVQFMDLANTVGVFYGVSQIGAIENTMLDQIKDTRVDTSSMDADFDNFLRGMSYLILAKHEQEPNRKRNLLMSADAELASAQDKYRISRQALADLAKGFYRGKSISGVDSSSNFFEVSFQDLGQVYVADALVPLGMEIDPSKVISLSVPVHYWMAQGLAEMLQDYCRGKSCNERTYSAYENNRLTVSMPPSMRDVVGSIENALKSRSFAQVRGLWSENGLGLTQKYPEDAVVLLQVDILATYFPQPLGENQRAIFTELSSKQFDLTETEALSRDMVNVIHALSRLRLAMDEQGVSKRTRLMGAEVELGAARDQASLTSLYQEIESQARTALSSKEIRDMARWGTGWRVTFADGDTINLEGPNPLYVSWGMPNQPNTNLVATYKTDQAIMTELKSKLAAYCRNHACSDQRLTWGNQQLTLPLLLPPQQRSVPSPE